MDDDELSAGERDVERRRVLLVDDDPHVRYGYARLLRSIQCEVITAENGYEAVERLDQSPCDVILSDVCMPGITGIEFLRAVRNRDLDVPVILMTGAPGFETAVKAVEYGAFSYLVKPVGLAELIDVIQRAIRLHKLAVLKRDALRIVGGGGKQLGDRASLDARFSRALARIWMALQPIVQCRDRLTFAYEALVRSNEPSLQYPVDLLDAAERLGRLDDLGRRVRERVAVAAEHAPPAALLFVNLHPSDLSDADLYSPNAPLTKISSRVVLEITERAPLDGIAGLSAKIARLRGLGFRVAVDDLGAGYAGLASFAQLDPEFVKLDMSLVRGVECSQKKRSIIRAMVRLCAEELCVQVVCEGVETSQERDTLTTEGCGLLQGHLFAKAAPGFPVPRWD
jgi:EAL domain-containing protein (putative c-di-GMP-specific phosphodiesterase class I)